MIKLVHDAEHIANDMLKSFSQPFKLNNKCYTVSCSIGIAMYPEHGNDNRTLLKHADSAMYYAKRQRNTYYTINENL